ncbi:DUF6249 domain-containing protein [Persicitalea jodogahamensis]|uniref:DUF6249 domain-containing protein n=1 Tax=Persicitalea jodogahamensis TaxID=402147 RepID=A0A8J3D5Z0_9BACT|nr:DUF6249 domain-containing protein [Persicitalea jodogahamensis]GHB79533.1 hypothetical protein GCM10007390_36950 [Persicitalea jodogahamensis]
MAGIIAVTIPIATTFILFWGIINILRIVKESNIKARMVELGHLEPDKQWITQKTASVADTYANLKYGILLVSVGAGLVIVNGMNLENNGPIIFGLLAIVAGVGFLTYFAIMKYFYKKAD